MKDVDKPEQVHRTATKVVRRQEHMPWQERLREQALFSVEERWFSEDLTVAFPHVQGSYQDDVWSDAWQADKRQQTQIEMEGPE